MVLVDVGRWRVVTALAVTLAATAVVLGLATPIAMDHVWMLIALAVSAAVARALGSGGGRSVLAAAGAVLVVQPGLHLVGEWAHVQPDHGSHHAGLAGVVLLACHMAVTVVLVGVLCAVETACRALLAALRRLARVLVWWLSAAPAYPGTTTFGHAPALSHQQRDRAPRPPRRGPPTRLLTPV